MRWRLGGRKVAPRSRREMEGAIASNTQRARTTIAWVQSRSGSAWRVGGERAEGQAPAGPSVPRRACRRTWYVTTAPPQQGPTARFAKHLGRRQWGHEACGAGRGGEGPVDAQRPVGSAAARSGSAAATGGTRMPRGRLRTARTLVHSSTPMWLARGEKGGGGTAPDSGSLLAAVPMPRSLAARLLSLLSTAQTL